MLDLRLSLSDQMIIERIRGRIDGQIDELKIQILSIETSSVDWTRIMSDAAFREPPFSPNDEKGFRDALIAEAVIQLVAASPKIPSICRIAFITGDELLAKATLAKTTEVENVRVLSSTEELKGLINTLVSAVDESFIQEMKIAADSFFFQSKNPETYIYKQRIKETILWEFSSQISAVPEGADGVERGKALVSRPRFKEKVGERIYWVSRIAFRMKVFKNEPILPPTPSGRTRDSGPYSGYSGFSGYAGYSEMDSESSDFDNAEPLKSIPLNISANDELRPKDGLQLGLFGKTRNGGQEIEARSENWFESKESNEIDVASRFSSMTGNGLTRFERLEQSSDIDVRGTSEDGKLVEDFQITVLYDKDFWKISMLIKQSHLHRV